MKNTINDDGSELDNKLLGAIQEELDNSCDRLDGATLSRLNKIHHEALQQAQPKGFSRSLLMPSGFVTACLLLVVFVNWGAILPSSEQPTSNLPVDDIDIWASSDNVEFFEDLEFYQWLAENEPSV